MSNVKRVIKSIPFVGTTASRLGRTDVISRARRLLFRGSLSYWEDRYRCGGTSGAGSYGRLADFKASVINEFVEQQKINSVIEFGCGDGAQLQIAKYPHYVGVDVAASSIKRCAKQFASDSTKSFHFAQALPETLGTFDLALSLDVIYHLIEDLVFDGYMQNLFGYSHAYVIIYSSNHDLPTNEPHVRHRNFTRWVLENAVGWELTGRVANRFPFDPRQPNETSFADFFFFARRRAALPRALSGGAERLGILTRITQST